MENPNQSLSTVGKLANMAESNSPEYWEVMYKLTKQQIAPDATDEEIIFFLNLCRNQGLNPLTGEIHLVPRYDSRLKRNRMVPVVGVTGYRIKAARSNKYEGQTIGEWCGKDGVWKNIWLESEPPAAARIAVFNKNFREPIYGMALYKNYVQTRKDPQTGKLTPIGRWAEAPEDMLLKCAEVQALKKAFPEDTAGLASLDDVPTDEVPDAIDPQKIARAKQRLTQVSPNSAPINGTQAEFANANADSIEVYEAEAMPSPATDTENNYQQQLIELLNQQAPQNNHYHEIMEYLTNYQIPANKIQNAINYLLASGINEKTLSLTLKSLKNYINSENK